jgi:hypothetical protein
VGILAYKYSSIALNNHPSIPLVQCLTWYQRSMFHLRFCFCPSSAPVLHRAAPCLPPHRHPPRATPPRRRQLPPALSSSSPRPPSTAPRWMTLPLARPWKQPAPPLWRGKKPTPPPVLATLPSCLQNGSRPPLCLRPHCFVRRRLLYTCANVSPQRHVATGGRHPPQPPRPGHHRQQHPEPRPYRPRHQLRQLQPLARSVFTNPQALSLGSRPPQRFGPLLGLGSDGLRRQVLDSRLPHRQPRRDCLSGWHCSGHLARCRVPIPSS